MSANAIYVNPTGWAVREFSHAQYNQYKQCPRKFYWERIKGWKQKQGANMEFGKAIEAGVKAVYRGEDPVEHCEMYWATVRENPKIIYTKEDMGWEEFRIACVGLMSRFKKDWQKYPPRNPIFPGFKNSLKRKDARTGVVYQTIPDLIDKDSAGEFIADIKAMGNLLDTEVPGLVVMDLQLRTQAAVHYQYSPNKTYRVALWNFCTKPKRVDNPTADEIRSGSGEIGEIGMMDVIALRIAHETSAMNYEECATVLGIANPKEAMKALPNKKKAPELHARIDAVIAKINDAHQPQYVIQWVEGVMTKEHAEEGLREELSVVPLIQAEYFPHVGGMRFPNNNCTWCSHRGLCMEELCGPREEYTQITNAELERFDADSMQGWD